MKANATVFWILTGFFAAEVALYTVWNLISLGEVEWLGTIGLGLCAIFCSLVAFYLVIVHRAQGGTLPEDRLDADIDDGEPEIGHFSPWSWWPILLAASAWLVFLGFAVAIWVALVGAAVGAICLVGWVYEHYRGNFAR